jgi:hypothetical protein
MGMCGLQDEVGTNLQVVTTALSVSCARHFRLLHRKEKSMALEAREEAMSTEVCLCDGKNLEW